MTDTGTLPDVVALSLGAGVQSTTLALLAAERELPRPDVAIFADTGWEPASVYAHLDRLTAVLADAGIPVVRVARGNLRTDAVDPDSRFTTIPYFIRNPAYDVPITTPCPSCAHLADDDPARADCPRCEGAGVEDTGQTRPATMREREGMGRRQCTSEYKLVPIRRHLRQMLGANPPDYRRVPKGRWAEQWIGFSTDEVGRANRRKDSGGVSYLKTRYPLLDLGMSRDDCSRWLRLRGWDSVAKSACIGCPFHGNEQWRELRDNHPDEWADAVEFDRLIRNGARGGRADLSLQGEAFLHRSRLPLDQAPIDRVTRAEWTDRQTDIFGQVADAEVDAELAEHGERGGCSPYGCEPVDL